MERARPEAAVGTEIRTGNHVLRLEGGAGQGAAAAARDGNIERFAKTGKKAQLVDQIALSLRQVFQGHGQAAALQEGLHQIQVNPVGNRAEVSNHGPRDAR